MSVTNIILLRRVANLGREGDQVKVRTGYARNYLIPRGDAIKATKNSLQWYESQELIIASKNQDIFVNAEQNAQKLNGLTIRILAGATANGRLYGSITERDIVREIKKRINENMEAMKVILDGHIKDVGQYNIIVSLHPDVTTNITAVVSRTEHEAEEIIREAANAKAAAESAAAAAAAAAIKAASQTSKPEPESTVKTS